MANQEKNILKRVYIISGCMLLFAVAIAFKLVDIQFFQGHIYRAKVASQVVENVVIPANRGNVYSSKGNLLATSVPKYDIRIDALTSSEKHFEKYIKPLADSLAVFLKKPSYGIEKNIRNARSYKNRYYLLARGISYSEYIRLRNFPLLKLGAFKGGLIVEQHTKREYPMGGIAQRTIGYERVDDQGNITRPGIDGAFGIKYLRGVDGHRKKQKIGKNQWKPLNDANEVEPKDGYDVYTTIDVNIQDIAHHALLEQLEKYKADHGCVVVMETKTGKIRAISNLGRNKEGNYYERLNYAVGESHESGSTFKLMALAAAFEDGLASPDDIVDTKQGVLSFYGNKIRDSKKGGYGKITLSEAFEVSSNTGIVSAVHKAYKKHPEKFVDRLYDMSLNNRLNIPIIGEPKPIIPDPRIKNGRWSGIALQWMAYGYGVSFTPLQILTFYNAIANNGVMVRPQFLNQVKEFDKVIEAFETEIINEQVCSKETVSKLQTLLKHVVQKEHGTGHRLYSKYFSMAGKTGTCQKDYKNKEALNYISSFAGYFPADNPKYSCIVVIHEPEKGIGYYGADVSGPVFKKIAQKIFIETPIVDDIKSLVINRKAVNTLHDKYYHIAQKYKTIMPNVVGMPIMDALSILENMSVNLKVQVKGAGIVKSQSIKKSTKLKYNQAILLEAS